jgi:hypothetical protein
VSLVSAHINLTLNYYAPLFSSFGICFSASLRPTIDAALLLCSQRTPERVRAVCSVTDTDAHIGAFARVASNNVCAIVTSDSDFFAMAFERTAIVDVKTLTSSVCYVGGVKTRTFKASVLKGGALVDALSDDIGKVVTPVTVQLAASLCNHDGVKGNASVTAELGALFGAQKRTLSGAVAYLANSGIATLDRLLARNVTVWSRGTRAVVTNAHRGYAGISAGEGSVGAAETAARPLPRHLSAAIVGSNMRAGAFAGLYRSRAFRWAVKRYNSLFPVFATLHSLRQCVYWLLRSRDDESVVIEELQYELDKATDRFESRTMRVPAVEVSGVRPFSAYWQVPVDDDAARNERVALLLKLLHGGPLCEGKLTVMTDANGVDSLLDSAWFLLVCAAKAVAAQRIDAFPPRALRCILCTLVMCAYGDTVDLTSIDEARFGDSEGLNDDASIAICLFHTAEWCTRIANVGLRFPLADPAAVLDRQLFDPRRCMLLYRALYNAVLCDVDACDDEADVAVERAFIRKLLASGDGIAAQRYAQFLAFCDVDAVTADTRGGDAFDAAARPSLQPPWTVLGDAAEASCDADDVASSIDARAWRRWPNMQSAPALPQKAECQYFLRGRCKNSAEQCRYFHQPLVGGGNVRGDGVWRNGRGGCDTGRGSSDFRVGGGVRSGGSDRRGGGGGRDGSSSFAPRQVCHHFARGFCNRGGKCGFQHVAGAAKKESNHGGSSRFERDASAQSSSSSTRHSTKATKNVNNRDNDFSL